MGQVWHSLRAYVPAVIKGWWALVPGVVVAVVHLVGFIRGDFALPVWVWLVVFGAGLVVAQFLAYHDLHLRHQSIVSDDRRPAADLAVSVATIGPADHRLVITNGGDIVLHGVTWELPHDAKGWNLVEQGLPNPWPELQPHQAIRIPLVFTMPATPTIQLRLTAVAGGRREWSPWLTMYG